MAYIVETENGELKSYFIKGIFNPCRCGSNVFHKANMTKAQKTFGVCNACRKTIYEYEDYQEFEEYEVR